MKIYFDMEFTGLHQNTTPISFGAVAETGETFYCEFVDYDETQVDSWLRDNVLKHRTGENRIRRDQFRPKFESWLQSLNKASFQMVSDCYAYDWVLFCQFFGGAMKVPPYIYYIPLDLSTMFYDCGIEPDINREEFAEIETGYSKHHALHDALIIKECFERLEKMFEL